LPADFFGRVARGVDDGVMPVVEIKGDRKSRNGQDSN